MNCIFLSPIRNTLPFCLPLCLTSPFATFLIHWFIRPNAPKDVLHVLLLSSICGVLSRDVSYAGFVLQQYKHPPRLTFLCGSQAIATGCLLFSSSTFGSRVCRHPLSATWCVSLPSASLHPLSLSTLCVSSPSPSLHPLHASSLCVSACSVCRHRDPRLSHGIVFSRSTHF